MLWHDSCEARGCCPMRQVFPWSECQEGRRTAEGNWRQVTVQT